MSQNLNILNFFIKNATEFPDKKAFIFLSENLEIQVDMSNKELADRVLIVAERLESCALYNKKVLCVYQNVTEFIVSFLACLSAGVIAIPVPYIRGKRKFWSFLNIIKDSKAEAVLCEDSGVKYIKGLANRFGEINVPFVITDIIQAAGSRHINFSMRPNNIAFIQYSSGSTSNPKGVIITHDNLIHNQGLIKEVFNCTPDSIIFSWLPFHHDMGLIGSILHSIYTGCCCFLWSPSDFIRAPYKWIQAISKYRITHSGGPNFAYDLCIDHIQQLNLSDLNLSQWEVAYNGSEPVKQSTLENFSEAFSKAGFSNDSFYPCYGLAEATLLVSGSRKAGFPLTITVNKSSIGTGHILTDQTLQNDFLRLTSCGDVPSGMTVKILSQLNNGICGELEEGEICISGASVTSGYLNLTEDSSFIDLDGEKYLKTGDMGFYYKNELFVHGRLKEIIIIRGINFYPYDIENLISTENSLIEDHGVVVFKKDGDQDFLVVVAELKRLLVNEETALELISTISRLVTGYCGLTPAEIILTATQGIPRTTSGKLKRLECRALYQTGELNYKYSHSQSLERTKILPYQDTLHAVLQQQDYQSIKTYVLLMIEMRTGFLKNIVDDDTIEISYLGLDSLRFIDLIHSVNKDLDINIDMTNIQPKDNLATIISTIESMLWLKKDHSALKEIII